MLMYPQIPGSTGMAFREFRAHVFDKLDGSNLRFEWSRKRGWYKQGTRERLFDETDTIFGPAIPTFQAQLAEPLAAVAKKERWDSLTVFVEYLGPHSFAGLHDMEDLANRKMQTFLIDASIDGRKLMPVKDYLKAFKSVENQAHYLGSVNWTRGFVSQVYATLPAYGRSRDQDLTPQCELETTLSTKSITHEGVIGKADVRDERIMAKAKTLAWLDKVRAKFTDVEAQRIIDS